MTWNVKEVARSDGFQLNSSSQLSFSVFSVFWFTLAAFIHLISNSGSQLFSVINPPYITLLSMKQQTDKVSD